MGFQAKNTRKTAPVRAVIYGPGGIGKSTLAASAPSPIFIAAEEGLEEIDAVAVEPYPTTWTEVLAALDYVATLDHGTIAIDSLDWLEPLCWGHVCSRGGKRILGKDGPASIEHIEAFGYGKGYSAALDEWRVFLARLSTLRAKGMNVILIAHAIRKMFKNPLGDDYEHWTIKLQEKAAGLIVEWCDLVGFASEDVATEETSGRSKAQSTGKRVLRTNPNPAYLAKTRYSMPAKLVLPRDRAWDVLAAALRAPAPETKETVAARENAARERLTAELDGMLVELADRDVATKVRAFVTENGHTIGALTEAIERLDVTISERRKAS